MLFQNCQIKNETFMCCPSPKLLTRVRRLRRSTAMVTAAIGFIMDNAVNVQNLTGINSQLQYYPDPSVYKFGPDKENNDNVKLFKSEIVIINVSLRLKRLQITKYSKPCFCY